MGGLAFSTGKAKVVCDGIFFWEMGEFKVVTDYLFLDYAFFLDFDFLPTDLAVLFPLLSLVCLCESAIILHFCLTDKF